MNFVRKYNYLVILSAIYLFFIILYWFIFSDTLLYSVAETEIIMSAQLVSMLSFVAFIILGFVREYVLYKIRDKDISNILINILILLICIFFTVRIRIYIGISDRLYVYYAILSFFYGVFLGNRILKYIFKDKEG